MAIPMIARTLVTNSLAINLTVLLSYKNVYFQISNLEIPGITACARLVKGQAILDGWI
jgi:hypothetical protein